MKKTWTVAGLFITGILLSCSPNAFGQQKEPATTAPAQGVTVTTVPPPGERTPPGAATFSFVSSEFAYDGNPIKGAPYSAEAITETTQILGDGNRIVNRSTATLYRDSEGRTRREQTLKSIGGVAAGAEPLQTITISDPVGGVSYSLDPASRTARKHSMGSFTFQRAVAGPTATSGGAFVFSSNGPESTARATTVTAAGIGNAVPLPSTNPPAIAWTAQSGGGAGYQIVTRDGRTEMDRVDLGTQNIEGVQASGTRVTFTIPAGEIGNERAIDIVDERWFSKDLQVVVMTRRSDPRTGETIYRLTNIDRSEPAHSLFEVPADYVLKDTTTALPTRTRRPE
jgi:hypothetical protein